MAQAVIGGVPIRRKNAIQNFFDDLRNFLRLMSRNRIGFFGFLVVIFMILFFLIAPFFIPIDTATKPTQIFKPAWFTAPDGTLYPLGTDFQGRDIWSRIVHGGREPMAVAILAATIATFIAVTLGALSAYMGGRVDTWITAFTDIFMTVPRFVLLVVLAAYIRLNNMVLLALLLGLLDWPILLRLVRAQILSLKERDYIEAARALDLSRWHIIFNELLPNMMAFIVISFALSITSTMSDQINLILLGVVPFTSTSWPIILYEAQARGAIFLEATRGYIYGPIIAIVIFQTAMVTMVRSLEEIFNPRLRGDI